MTYQGYLDEITNKYSNLEVAKKASLIELQSILEGADDVFMAGIALSERKIFSVAKKILRQFKISGGKIEPDITNHNVLLKLNKGLGDAYAVSGLRSNTAKFLQNFDKVEILAKEVITLNNLKSQINALKLNVSAEKALHIEELSRSLATRSGFRVLTLPIKRLMYQFATTGIAFSAAEALLEEFIIAKGKGFIQPHVRRLAVDSINQFHRSIQQQAINEFEMTHFQFVGSLIATSRNNCIQMVKETGEFAKLITVNGYYRVRDIPKIIAIAKNGSGWIKGTTVENYITLANGWGCRHLIIASIDPDDVEIVSG